MQSTVLASVSEHWKPLLALVGGAPVLWCKTTYMTQGGVGEWKHLSTCSGPKVI